MTDNDDVVVPVAVALTWDIIHAIKELVCACACLDFGVVTAATIQHLIIMLPTDNNLNCYATSPDIPFHT